MQATPALWERQPGEGPRAYAAFCAYRGLPPRERSLDAAARVLNPGSASKRAATGRLQEWSSTFRWVARAAAWDAHVDAQARDAHVEAVRELQRKHQDCLSTIFDQFAEAIRGLNWSKLTPTQAVHVADKLITLQRLVIGEPVSVERMQHTGGDGGPIRQVVAHTTFNPSPAEIAEVMRILGDCGALDEPPGADVAPGQPLPTRKDDDDVDAPP
jgi:hypothetical protein